MASSFGTAETAKKTKYRVFLKHDETRYKARSDIDNYFDKSGPQAILTGLAGVGKTTEALRWCRHSFTRAKGKETMNIFWANASSVGSLEQSFELIAVDLELIEGDVQETSFRDLVVKHMETDLTTKWLLVLDDAKDRSSLAAQGMSLTNELGENLGESNKYSQPPNLMEWLPETWNVQILITTRDLQLPKLWPGVTPYRADTESEPIDGHFKPVARRILRETRSGKSPEKVPGLRELLEQTKFNPLIATIASYLAEKNVLSIVKFTSDFNQQQLVTENNIDAALIIVRQRLGAVSLYSQRVLEFTAFLAGFVSDRAVCYACHIRPEDATGALESIVRLGLIRPMASDRGYQRFSMSLSIQSALRRITYPDKALYLSCQKQVLNYLVATYPTDVYGEWKSCSSAESHVNMAFTYLFDTESKELNLLGAGLLQKVARYNSSMADFKTAVSRYKRAIDIFERHRTPNSVLYELFEANLGLGNALVGVAGYNEAESVLTSTLQSCNPDQPPPELRDTMIVPIKTSLAELDAIQGHNRAANEKFENVKGDLVLSLAELSHEARMAYARFRVKYAEFLYGRGEAMDAHDNIRSAMLELQKLLPHDHPERLDAHRVLSLVAQITTHDGLSKSEEALKGVLKTLVSSAGKYQPFILQCLYDLAKVMHKQGKHEGAMEHVEPALRGYEFVYGVDHRLTKRTKKLLEDIQDA